jgi:hypothetical protein
MGMSQWFVNPRRSPRLPLRCPVVVDPGGAAWGAETEDVGPRGCQLVLPRPLPAGRTVRLSIEAPAAGRPLPVAGRVAWVVDRGRIRAGIQFSPGQPEGDPAAWFRRLVRGDPALGAATFQAPERLAGATPLFLRPPPRFIVDLAPEEVTLVRFLRDGMALADLVAAAPLPGVLAGRLVFALLERRVLTLSVSEAVPAWRWHAVLDEVERGPAPAVSPPVSPAARPAARSAAPVPVPAAPVGAAGLAGPAVDPTPPVAPAVAPVPAVPATVAPRAGDSTPAPPLPVAPPPAAAAPGAPSLYGAVSRQRPAEAQECLDRAREATAAGDISGAIALLRRALALAPRDAEISAELGVLAFRDRIVT